MKKIIISMIVTLSATTVLAFGGDKQRETVTVPGQYTTGAAAYAAAQDMAAMINAANGFDKIPGLVRCNATSGDMDDNSFYRKAFTTQSMVSLNYVTNLYTSKVRVVCED